MKGAQQGTQPRSHILRWQSCHILGHQTAQQLQSRALPCPCRGSCTACSGGGVRSSSAATRPCCRSSVRTSPACCYLTASAGTFVVLAATVLAPATAVTVAGTSHSSAARSAAGMPVTLHPLSGRKHRANFEPLTLQDARRKHATPGKARGNACSHYFAIPPVLAAHRYFHFLGAASA